MPSGKTPDPIKPKSIPLDERFRSLAKYIERPWYMLLVSFLAALDIFILIIPTDFFVICTSALKPKSWIKTFLWITTGSALGALAMAMVLRNLGIPFLESLGVEILDPSQWPRITSFIESHGALALGLLAFGPFPLQPGAIAIAATDMPLSVIFIAVWIGRSVKYALFSWAAAFAPKFIHRIFPTQTASPPNGAAP